MSAGYTLGIVLDAWDIQENKIDKDFHPCETHLISWERQEINSETKN